jgi:cell division protein FtsB
VLERFRPYAVTVVLGFATVYFAAQGLTGEKGVLTSGERAAELQARKAELERLVDERRDLEARVRLLRDDRLSADLLEERARALLGYADPRDFVIRMRRDEAAAS